MKTSYLLQYLYNLLEDEMRWSQGQYGFTTSRYCLVGALMCVSRHIKSEVIQATQYLESATGSSNLMTWNDSPERLHAHVLDAIIQAKKAALAKGD